MQFTKVILGSALLAMANAYARFSNSAFTGITAGTPFNITYTDATGPVNIILKTGPAGMQTAVRTIGSGVTAGYLLWTPTESGTFNFEIDDAGFINYSAQFQVTGGTPLATSSGVTSTGTVTMSSTTSVSNVVTITTTSASTSTASSSNSSSTGSSARSTGSSTTTRASSTGSTPVPTTNAATQQASSFALAVLAFAAFMSLN